MERHPMNLNLPPAVWLVIWLASTAATCILVAWAAYQAGWDHCDRDHHPARHATGSPAPAPPLPVAGRLDPLPELDPFPGWSFFGGAQVEPQPGADEYRLMVAQAADAREAAGEQPSGPFDLMGALASVYEPCKTCESAEEFMARQEREIDELVDRIQAQTNYLIHTRFAPGE
jgi:hypothetical protein